MTGDAHLRRPDPRHLRREWDTVAGNALRLDRAAAGRLVTALNADVAGLYVLFNQLRKHHWLAEGAESDPVSGFLSSAADRLTATTDDVAVRIHALGGVPVCGPMGLRQHAPMGIEAAHHYDLRSSLERDLEGYAVLVEAFREHVALAEELGDAATGELLREHLETLEADAIALAKYCDADSLVVRDGR